MDTHMSLGTHDLTGALTPRKTLRSPVIHSSRCAERGFCPAEAEADAKTLRLYLLDRGVVAVSAILGTHALGAETPDGAFGFARQAARAAFTACWSLFGPDYSDRCTRWGFDPNDRCVLPFGHSRACRSRAAVERDLSLVEVS